MKKLDGVSNSFELYQVLNKHRVMLGEKPYRNHADLVIKIIKHCPYFCKNRNGLIYKERVNNLGKVVKDKGYILTDPIIDTMISRELNPKLHAKAYAQREHGALCAIEQIKGIKLERQYMVKTPCGKRFFVDGYDNVNNIAYEIDEEHHTHQQGNDNIRQVYIEEMLGCTFVRVTV